MSFETLANKLGPFETFDRKAFIGDEKVPQNVCDFVLSLALAYNDFKDIFFSRKLLDEVQVDLQAIPTVKLALRNGIENTILRIHSGFIHELLNLLKDHEKAILEPAFQRVLRQMSKQGKLDWKVLVDVATSRPSDHPVAHALLIIRNKVAFHYDPKQLGKGYSATFVETTRCGDPLISRGAALAGTRFYFADASSQECIFSKADAEEVLAFLRGEGNFIESINCALYETVIRFLQMRSAWSQPRFNS